MFAGRTKLGTSVCRSTKDSEMMAIIAALASILGFRFLLNELGFVQDDPTTVYIDATAALDQTTSMNIPRDQKFMALRRRWVYEQFRDLLVKAEHCDTINMLADASNKTHNSVEQGHNARNLMGHGEIRVTSVFSKK